MSQPNPSLRVKVSRLFRERELYVRSEGHIRYITLKPYMLVLLAGFLVTLLTTGIVSSVGYYVAQKSAIAFRENLNTTTDSYKFGFEKSLKNRQKHQNSKARSSSAKLAKQKKKHVQDLEKLRNAYELELALFQSSISQINGRMVENQDTYTSELERLRVLNKSLQRRHTKLEELMDQGWAPRMVTLPEQGQSDSSEVGQGSNQRAPENSQKIKPKKNSSLGPDTGLPENLRSKTVAQINPSPSTIETIDATALKSAMRDQWKKQNRTSAQINFAARKRVKELTQILSRLKYNLAKLTLQSDTARPVSTGGPFYSLTFSDIAANLKKIDNFGIAASLPFKNIYVLEQALLELPIRRPLSDLRSITSPYGPRMDPFRKIFAMHRGIDFRAPTGEPVLATTDGVVVLAQNNSKSGYGKVLVIRHKNGITTLFGHLSEFSVQVGDRVKPGDVVGKVGNTGRSTGPHLHYEIRVNDSHVDPIDYLEAATYVF